MKQKKFGEEYWTTANLPEYVEGCNPDRTEEVAPNLFSRLGNLFLAGIRADIAAQSAMQQRRYDDLVGLCESIEAQVEAVVAGIDLSKKMDVFEARCDAREAKRGK
jgi:hypothetical protein